MYVRIHVCVHICTYISVYVYRMRKNSTPKLRELIEGTKTNTYFQGIVCRRRVLVAPRTVKLGQSLEVKRNRWSILKKSYVSCRFRADVGTYGHRSLYTAHNDAAETDVCTQKCQLAALVVAAASAIRAIRSSSELTGDVKIKVFNVAP